MWLTIHHEGICKYIQNKSTQQSADLCQGRITPSGTINMNVHETAVEKLPPPVDGRNQTYIMAVKTIESEDWFMVCEIRTNLGWFLLPMSHSSGKMSFLFEKTNDTCEKIQ